MYKFFKLIGFLLLLLSILFGSLAFIEYKQIFDNKELYEEVVNNAILVESEESPLDRIIDFNYLKSVNGDIVGWIYIPGTNIDYPIVRGSNDYEYLEKDFKGNSSKLGTIFTSSDYSMNFVDARMMLYGHNMKGDLMFGELKNFLNESFYSGNRKLYIYTETSSSELDIFSVFTCSTEKSEYYEYKVEKGTSEYKDLLGKISMLDRYKNKFGDYSEYYNSQMVSLVTCHGDSGTTNRLVVNALVIREKYVVN